VGWSREQEKISADERGGSKREREREREREEEEDKVEKGEQ
jgi:hypothetical protein